jgi:integrase
MARTPRKSKGNIKHSIHSVLDGTAQIFKVPQSGDVYQFRMYIRTDKKHYRISLKTRDLESALSKARDKALELSAYVRNDIKIFGMTIDELIAEYIEYRHNDVINGDIVKERLSTIKSQLTNMANIKGGDIKLAELDRDCMFDYAQERKLQSPTVADVTIRNEQATINAMIQYAYRKGNIHFEKLNFKKIRIRKDDIGVRDTFTPEEYDQLILAMRSYVTKKNCPDDDERFERLMIRDYVLISSNTYLRVGEARQLTWGDIDKFETHIDENERQVILVTLTVRAETSKVRATRKMMARGGEYFIRLKKRTEFTEPTHLLFSLNGVVPLDARKWQKHWVNLMNDIGIHNHKERKLTWYSLRHFGITMRVMSGVNLIDLSKLAGTSVSHIENTYLKYSEAQSRTAALKNFRINTDGTLLEL